MVNAIYPLLVIFNTLYDIATNIKDSVLNVFDDAVYYFFGYTDVWGFFENEHIPVQVRYISPSYMSEVDYFYNNSTNLWYTSYKNAIVSRIPWISAVIEVGSRKYDISEYIMEQKIRVNALEPFYPSADMLVAAWSIKTGKWFTFEERCNATLRVMNDACDEFELGLILNSDEEVNIFGNSIKIENYVQNVFGSIDTESEPESEESEPESDTEESEEPESDTEESEEPESESAPEPEPTLVNRSFESETEVVSESDVVPEEETTPESKKDN